ncbi:MAG: WbqC family protein [Pirellulaceae bacterium]
MRIAIMQPYFLPYLGYFSLIAASEKFVVFDPVQYIRRGWVNRNRILKPGLTDDQYVAVPVAKHSRDTTIRNIKIAKDSDWKAKLRSQTDHYRKKAPFYHQAREILDACLAIQTESLVELNVHSLATVCQAVGIPFRPIYFVEIQPAIEPPQHAGQWALHIADRLGASSYINPIGGHDIFQRSEFTDKGIELQFLTHQLSPYCQRNNAAFVAGLSILDVLMFNSLDETRQQITGDYVVTD